MCLTKCPPSSTGSYMIIFRGTGPLDNSQMVSSQQTGPQLHKVVTFVGSATAMQHCVVLSAPPHYHLLSLPLFLSLFLSVSPSFALSLTLISLI